MSVRTTETAPSRDVDPCAACIRDLLAGPRGRWPVAELVRQAAARTNRRPQAVRRALSRCVAAGELIFTCLGGTSMVEVSPFRPRALAGGRILLVPAPLTPAGAPGQTVVRLAPGDAFGTGRHPSTVLALEGLLAIWPALSERPRPVILDIGTGSGILALTALALGGGEALGLERDPCARHEARHNAALNGLQDRMRVTAGAVADLEGTYDLVLANLRSPTLATLEAALGRVCRKKSGWAVLAGMRPGEVPAVHRAYLRSGWRSGPVRSRSGWAAVSMQAPDG